MGPGISAIYLLAQGAVTIVWWLLLWGVPQSRAFFKPVQHVESVLLAFWMADLVGVAGGSLVAGLWIRRGDRRAGAAVWFATGSVVYGALYCTATTWLTGQAMAASGLMVPAAIVTSAIAIRTRVS